MLPFYLWKTWKIVLDVGGLTDQSNWGSASTTRCIASPTRRKNYVRWEGCGAGGLGGAWQDQVLLRSSATWVLGNYFLTIIEPCPAQLFGCFILWLHGLKILKRIIFGTLPSQPNSVKFYQKKILQDQVLKLCSWKTHNNGDDSSGLFWLNMNTCTSLRPQVGETGKILKDVVAIGIGGSYLGPLFAYTALQTGRYTIPQRRFTDKKTLQL